MNCLKCLLQIDDPSSAHYGLHPACFMTWFNVANLADFISLQGKSSASSDEPASHAPQNTSFFHGKFKKYSADLNGSSYILKMRQEDAQELPEIEYVCNQIGKQLGLPVAEFYFINFHGDRTFVTKNFIKPGTPTDLQHIYHFRPDDQHSCEGLIRAITEKTQSPYDVSVFIKTTLFDALIGNHDRHGRNLGLIVTSRGATLSPIYDNVSYLILEEGEMLKADHNPTGRVCTSETFEPNMCDYVKEFKKLGYIDEIKDFYQNIKIDQLLQLIDVSFCSDLMKEALKNLIKKRFEELQNELFN